MQCAYDRDDFVTIHWENMMKGASSNFVKYSNKEVTHFNTTYDYYSVMHYTAYAFSKNKQPTIVPHVSKMIAWNALIKNKWKLSSTNFGLIIFQGRNQIESNWTTHEVERQRHTQTECHVRMRS